MDARFLRRFYEPDDGGSPGAVDDTADTGGAESKKAPPAPAPISKEVIEAMGSAIRDGLRGVTVQAAAAPAAAPNVEAEHAAAVERAEALKKQINEVAATGDVAAAMDLMVRHLSSTAPKADLDNDPGFKAMVKTARKLAASEHGEVFAKYGAEIDAEIAKLPPTARIDADSYGEAVLRVKARHFDEILEERLRERATRRADGVDDFDDMGGETRRVPGTVVAPGSRGSRRDPNTPEALAAKLTAEERGIADSFGIDYVTYARQKKEIDGRESRVEFLPPATVIKAGSF